MAENNVPKTLCKSVFKSGKNTTTECDVTKKWIELINTLEKCKTINFCESTTTAVLSLDTTSTKTDYRISKEM